MAPSPWDDLGTFYSVFGAGNYPQDQGTRPERVDMLGGLLRELALGLHSPVLALASQNRSAGNYGNGKGSAALDSLKESGDWSTRPISCSS